MKYVWRLVYRVTGTETYNEELIASFQGIICKKDLPLFTERLGYVRSLIMELILTYNRSNSGLAKCLQQSVSITGLQSLTFDKIIHTVAEIHAVFSRAVGNEKLEECQIITSYKGMSALELSNHCFTPCKDMAEGSELVLSANIGPYGYLAKAAGVALCYRGECHPVF